MMKPGDVRRLAIEKPAAGGAMIARAGGHVVLVSGAIPGEEADVRIDRIGKGVAFGRVVDIVRPSPDRRTPAFDPECGGCLYAHIEYDRQVAIKADVIADAFGRIAKAPLAEHVAVMASPEQGYRMRARLHLRAGQWGFFLEQTHRPCDARATGQLHPGACDALDAVAAGLGQLAVDEAEIDLSENREASDRAIHVTVPPRAPDCAGLRAPDAVSGLSVSEQGRSQHRVLAGRPVVRDRLVFAGAEVTLDRNVLAFFQGNRFLLQDLAAHVVESVGEASEVADLYSGVGLFAVPLAAGGRTVTAVEGDPVSSADLKSNAEPCGGRLTARAESVEAFVSRGGRVGAVVVDPPRTGMSREALAGAIAMAAPRLVYVSCDVATLARDTRVLLDAGYRVSGLRAFDLFPNTPHVETVVLFQR